jgi:hypothetical protein
VNLSFEIVHDIPASWNLEHEPSICCITLSGLIINGQYKYLARKSAENYNCHTGPFAHPTENDIYARLQTLIHKEQEVPEVNGKPY